MHDLVEIIFEDPRWEAAGLAGLADRAARAALADLGLDPAGLQIGLLACDDSRISALNAEFRGKPAPTNVLSWPAEDLSADVAGEAPDLPAPGDPADPAELGDIAIAWDTCLREAAEQDKPFDAHVTHLIVHALLHLVGYDHVEDADAALMEAREVRILASLGIPDPY